VTLDGNPVAGATVMFVPVGDQGRPAQALTGPDGSFRLATTSKEGAGRGEYQVLVTKTTGMLAPGALPSSPAAPALRMQRGRGASAKPGDKSLQSLLPETYGDTATTPFRFAVPHTGIVVLELKSSSAS